MLKKQFVTAFICLTIFYQVTVSYGSSFDEAKQALQELDDLFSLLSANITKIFFDEEQDFRKKLNAEISAAEQEVDTQVAAISEKITVLVQNTKAAGVDGSDSCLNATQSELDNFAKGMKETIGVCYGINLIYSMNGLLASSYNKMWYEYSTAYNCNNMSLAQCSQHENPNCFDFVIGNINNAKEKMTKTLTINQADVLNQTPQINSKCRQLAAQEMYFYPTVLLNFVSSCIRSITADARVSYSGCGF